MKLNCNSLSFYIPSSAMLPRWRPVPCLENALSGLNALPFRDPGLLPRPSLTASLQTSSMSGFEVMRNGLPGISTPPYFTAI